MAGERRFNPNPFRSHLAETPRFRDQVTERRERPLKPKVFLSYTLNNPQYMAHIHELSKVVRDQYDCDIELDQDVGDGMQHPPAEGWHPWMERGVRTADRLGLIFSETYRADYNTVMRGPGARFELSIIKQLLEDPAAADRLVALYDPSLGIDMIPPELRGQAVSLDDPAGFASVLWGGQLPDQVQQTLLPDTSKAIHFLEKVADPHQARELLLRRLFWSGDELHEYLKTTAHGLGGDGYLRFINEQLQDILTLNDHLNISVINETITHVYDSNLNNSRRGDNNPLKKQFFDQIFDPLRRRRTLTSALIDPVIQKSLQPPSLMRSRS